MKNGPTFSPGEQIWMMFTILFIAVMYIIAS